MDFLNQEEKKVEYLELIYDLVFVYMIGRNSAFLHEIENGFVPARNFAAYLLCTLAIIQIWNFTTFYINMFGRNGLRDHIFLCSNMYLMYFVGDATREEWITYQSQYHIAWGLILVNIGAQYLIELRLHKADVWNRDIIKRMALTLFVEASIVFAAAIPVPSLVAPLSAAAIAAGMILTSIGKTVSPGGMVDFSHLTERAMLYVVFTFGEMIIAISGYFEGGGSFSWNVIYFSLMGFLVVVGLFLSYGIVYDHLIDRERNDNGLTYMFIHIFIILMLNNITAALEFMREPAVALMPKMVFMVLSIVGYYLFLFCLGRYARVSFRFEKIFLLKLGALTAAFVALMAAFRNYSYLHILVTVVYIFSIVLVLYRARRAFEQVLG